MIIMIKIYMDTCCYNRPFDDLHQEKIGLEEKAIEDILIYYSKNMLCIYSSKVVDFEITKINDHIKRRNVEDFYNNCDTILISFSKQIKNRAEVLKKSNIKDMDALHLAYAESVGVDYFITTDKLLINGAKRSDLKMKVINPISFVMEVL